jgi:hypothetical protein
VPWSLTASETQTADTFNAITGSYWIYHRMMSLSLQFAAMDFVEDNDEDLGILIVA